VYKALGLSPVLQNKTNKSTGNLPAGREILFSFIEACHNGYMQKNVVLKVLPQHKNNPVSLSPCKTVSGLPSGGVYRRYQNNHFHQ
jgi:hypothetical protein